MMFFFLPLGRPTVVWVLCWLFPSLQLQTNIFCLLSFRPHDYSSEGFNDWAFMTTHSWDEDPRGEWTLEIENVVGTSDYGNSTLISSPSSSLFYTVINACRKQGRRFS